MRMHRILQAVHHEPWLITPQGYATIRQITSSNAFAKVMAVGEQPSSEATIEDSFSLFVNQRKPMAIDKNGIAHIQVVGPIGHHVTRIERACGITDVQQVHDDLDAALGSAKGIMFYAATPGGTTVGVPELAERIASIGIPTAMFTDDMCCSAGYYLMAGVDRMTVSPSAAVGSIGVFIPWIDWSAYYEEWGAKHDPIINEEGTLKAIGFEPRLRDEHRAFLQDQVERVYADFKAHVLRFRDIDPEAIHGQAVNGKQALGYHLVDAVGGFDEAYADLLKRV